MEPNDEHQRQDLTNGCFRDGTILSEEWLRRLSKSLTKRIPRNGIAIDEAALIHLESLHHDLLRTAGSPKLSLTHGAAALSSLCGFLEQCGDSSVPRIYALPSTFESWTRAFDIFLTRTENNKAKLMRRLLFTLINLIFKHPAEDLKLSLTGHAICYATQAIRKQQDFASIKAAIQVLEHLLTKDVANAIEIVQINAPQELKEYRTRQSPRETDTSKLISKVQSFTSSILEWIKYPDCAPAAGRFLPAFFKSLGAAQDQDILYMGLPLWIYPIKQSLERHPSLLEIYENHVIPDLLRLSAADRTAFRRTLPLDDIQCGKLANHTILDIQICLLVAKIEFSLEPISRTSQDRAHKTEDGDLYRALNTEADGLAGEHQRTEVGPIRFGTNLLEHSSPVVRIAAFSLLTSSSISQGLLSEHSLNHLQRSLPCFHVEVNAKARNEFIALMKKLCIKLRGSIMSLIRNDQNAVITGLNQGTAVRADATTDEQHQHVHRQTLERQLGFRLWYIRFLIDELRPTASYQSHITALKILYPLLQGDMSVRANLSKTNVHNIRVLEKDLPYGLLLRPLFDLLFDPFDDVRQTANLVLEVQFNFDQVPASPGWDGKKEIDLQRGPENESVRATNSIIQSTLAKAESKAERTGRADHADGVGRLHDLLYGSSESFSRDTAWHDSPVPILEHLISKLEKEVRVAKDDLLLAVSSAPLHGHLIALRYLTSRSDYWTSLTTSTSNGLKLWKLFNTRILSICSHVWEAVKDVLCLDAPEGNNVADDEFNDVDVGTKDTLSYCWRALKESSSLMHSMVTNNGYSQSNVEQRPMYLKLGWLSLIQLGELRHRGAFSTVSLTFAACCTACAHSSDSDLTKIPKIWYQEALERMAQNASALTRRSAGLPAMITGVLAAYPCGAFFNDVVLDLQAIADEPASCAEDSEDILLPQIHALNCLKDIFTDARFGTSTEIHMAETLEIAASCLESPIWAIRNCGLMLFKALLRRLNGGTDTASTKVSSSHRRSSHLAYAKYPNLPALILKLLNNTNAATQMILYGQEASTLMKAQSVFAALEVIERSGIPPTHEADILDALWRYAKSPDWSIREKAAKALSLIVNDHYIEAEFLSLLSASWESQNALHGRLLCLRFLLSRAEAPLFGQLLSAYERLLPLIDERFESMVILNPCPITAAAFLDCIAELCVMLIGSRSPVTQWLGRMKQDRFIPIWSAQQGHVPTDPVSALRTRALSRLLTLNKCAMDSEMSQGPDGRFKVLQNLPQRDIEAIVVVDKTHQYDSDENLLATLKETSSRELRCASIVEQYSCRNYTEGSKLPSNPCEIDYTLALMGYSQGTRYAGNPGNVGPMRPITSWVRMLQVAGSEHSELRTRSSAAFSIRGFFDALLDSKVQPESESEMLSIYLVLYDNLVDDDEDVRDQGASTVSKLLSAVSLDSTTRLSLSPPGAKRALLQFLRNRYRSSTAMFVNAARRLIGTQTLQDADTLKLRTVTKLSLEAQTTQTAVFVEEKQNLYIDEVKEVENWADVLVGLDQDAWDANLAGALEKWAVEGLIHFLEIFESNTDGALGLTSKPEMYTLIMQVIQVARVSMSRPVLRLMKKKQKEDPCRRLLAELHDLGKKRMLHESLIDRVRHVLEESYPPLQQR